MKKEKSGLLLVFLVKYLIRVEIKTLWSFLRVLSGFQSPHDAIISFPSPAPNSFHTLRGRGLEVVLQNPLVSLAKFYIQGFRYLPQMTLMPFQIDLSWSITFPLFLKSDDTVITFLPHLVACLTGLRIESESKEKLSDLWLLGYRGMTCYCRQVSGPGNRRSLYILVTMASVSLSTNLIRDLSHTYLYFIYAYMYINMCVYIYTQIHVHE